MKELVPVNYYVIQVCDDSNQAKGFSTVGTTGGLGRLSVSTRTHSILHSPFQNHLEPRFSTIL